MLLEGNKQREALKQLHFNTSKLCHSVSKLICNWTFIGISVLERFPEVWNTGVKVTEENAYRVYSTLYDMIKTLKLMLVIIFSFLTINSIHMTNLPTIFLPIMLILIFGNLIYHLIKLHRVK